MRELGVWSLSACALAWLVGAPAVPLSGQLLGPEFQVNSYTTGYQTTPAVGMDGAGKFVVVWTRVDPDLTDREIAVQRFDAGGVPEGGESQANSFTTGNQWFPALATAPAGGFLAIWEGAGAGDPDSGVFGQPFDAAGDALGGALLFNSYTTGEQGDSAVAADGQGNFVVVWTSADQDGSDTGIFGRRVGPTGTLLGGEFEVPTYTTGFQVTPAVAADSAGNFLVVWASVSLDNSQSPIMGRRFNTAGVAQGDEFQINANSTERLSDPAVAADGAGSFVVTWNRPGDALSLDDVVARRVDASGVPVGDEVQVNTHTPQRQRGARVATGAAGSFVVVWESLSGQDGSYSGVFARRFDGTGSPITSEFQVNSYSTGNQAKPAIAGDGSGAFVVTWISDGQDGSSHGIFGQRLQPLLFADGFEGESVCGWSEAAGSGDICP